METEYLQIIDKIISNRKFKKLVNERHHHNSNRYQHLIDVSYKTYKVCKKLGLDYVSATRAAVLHDFYFDKDFTKNRTKMVKHYKVALKNAGKLCNLSPLEENIIASHMFPVGGKLPKYKESVVVNAIDDVISIKERVQGDVKKFRYAIKLGFFLLIGLLR